MEVVKSWIHFTIIYLIFHIFFANVSGIIRLNLYKRPEFQGESLQLYVDTGICTDFPNIWKRNVASLELTGSDCVKIYENVDCFGDFMQLSRGNSSQRDLSFLNEFNRKASSVINCDPFISPGIPGVISVFWGNFRGTSEYEQITLGDYLPCHNFREQVNGLFVHGNCVKLYEDIGCYGQYYQPTISQHTPNSQLIRFNQGDNNYNYNRRQQQQYQQQYPGSVRGPGQGQMEGSQMYRSMALCSSEYSSSSTFQVKSIAFFISMFLIYFFQ